MKHRFLEYAAWNKQERKCHPSTGFWFRIFGYGVHIVNSPLLFSERHGYTKIRKLPFGFRLKYLTPVKDYQNDRG